MSDGAILKIDAIHKGFGGIAVLADLSLELRPGERRGLIGPNGAGKTTLINLITGKHRPDAGRILYRGKDITALPPHRRSRLGMARSFQILSLFDEATVAENIRAAVLRRRGLAAAPLRRLSRLPEIDAEGREIAAMAGLLPVLGEVAATLPYGLQRRLDLALVLAQDPELVILDEPAAGLSAAETRELIDLLDVFVGNRALLLVEHDMDVVYALAERITVLDYGRVLIEGTPTEISASAEVQRVYLGTVH